MRHFPPASNNNRVHFTDLDSERSLLGGLMAEEAIPESLRRKITAEAFSEQHRLTAQAILSAFERSGRCDILTVSQELDRLGGGLSSNDVLMRLAESAPVGRDLDRLYGLILERNGRPENLPFTHPLSKLLEAPDELVPYLVERLIVQAANGFIGGEPKSLKSWLALYLALCLSLAVPVFDRYPVPQRVRVLFISEEDGERRVRRRIRNLLKGLGMNPPEDEFFRYSIKAGVLLDDPEWIKCLREELAEYQPGIVIGDVFELMHSKDGDKRSEMKPVFRNLDRLREEFSCGFLLADHFKKASVGTSKRGGQRLSGTVGKHAWGENSLYLFPSQGANRVRVETELKDGPSEVFGLALEDTEDGGVVFTWQAEAADREGEMKTKALAAVEGLALDGSWVKTNPIAEAMGVSPNTATKYLNLLVDEDRKLDRERRQEGKAKPFFWRLRAI